MKAQRHEDGTISLTPEDNEELHALNIHQIAAYVVACAQLLEPESHFCLVESFDKDRGNAGFELLCFPKNPDPTHSIVDEPKPVRQANDSPAIGIRQQATV